ncbi:MAG TPA: hypothetical protein VMK65_03760, partial [Longimicrobiales bacterium]|nr:hypothetical protein [Longimicrobiales bacterium]
MAERLDGALPPGERPAWPEMVGERLGPLARAQAEALAQNETEPAAFSAALAARLALFEDLRHRPDGAPERIARDTAAACAFLDALRADSAEPAVRPLRARLPLLAALALPASRAAAVEHEGGGSGQPLLDHLSVRVLGRKLLGLERGGMELFQRGRGVSPERFAAERRRLERIARAGLLPAARTALLHFDFAKGGSPEQRRAWSGLPGVDLGVHNEAAAAILAADGLDPALLPFPAAEPLVRALVASHGVTGQIVRGESPLSALAPFAAFLRGDDLAPLATALDTSVEAARELTLDLLHLLNVCDTAGVREELLDDRLADELEDTLRLVLAARGAAEPAVELEAHERQRWADRLPGAPAAEVARRRLADRLTR